MVPAKASAIAKRFSAGLDLDILLGKSGAQIREFLQALYIFVTYNFCTTVCYTAVNLPYGSLSAMMTRDSHERDILSVFRVGMAQFGKIIAVTFTLPLVKVFGDDQMAWVKCMGLCFGGVYDT